VDGDQNLTYRRSVQGLIAQGGENVSSVEVESTVMRTSVLEAAAVAYPE